jgi:hypothetical protein
MALPTFESDEFEFPDEKEEKVKRKAEEPELKVEIEDDTPPQDRGRKPMREPVEDPTEDELSSYDEKVQARIKKFTRGYHDERRAKEEALREREAAEVFARQVWEQNKQLQHQLSHGSKAYIETSKGAAEVRLLAAKKKLKDAFEAGNADDLADAQAEVSDATADLREAARMQPVEVREEQFVPATPQQPAQPRMTPRMESWVEKNNDWWGRDEEMTLAAMGIDKKLQREYGPDYVGTEEYFKTVDRTMRKRFPEHFEAQSDEEDDPPQRKRSTPVEEDDEPPRRASKSAAVVAPASRSTPPSRIRLKASQANIARRLGVPLEQYAKQVALLNRGE